MRVSGGIVGALLCLTVLFGDGSGSAEQPDTAAPHQVPRTGLEIKVDGFVDEPAWESALLLELPFETHPGDNIAAPVRTELRLTYDDDNLYVAFVAHDPEAGAIRAHYSDRDKAFSDDFVGIVLDTFNDERRAFEFFVNPLGVQMDLLQDDVSGNEDATWDAIWDSAGHLNGVGYNVELAVPFASLRFPHSDQPLVFGLDAVRIYPRDFRRRLGLNPLDQDRNCYLCQTTKIQGFAGVRPGKNLELVPSFTATRTEVRGDEGPRGPFEADSSAEPGVTAIYALTSDLTFASTANPDFSQVEADVAQLAVNERFALFFPEKRPFFLEGSDYFDTPLNAVFTRTVADPSVGLKLTGKQGRNTMGVLFARDEINNLIFPGPQSSAGSSLDDPVYSTVLRYRRDVGEGSSLGALMTDREGDDYHNRVFGVDALFRPRPSDTFRVQYLRSDTRYPDPVAEEFEQPQGSFTGDALKLHYDNGTRNWGWWGLYEDKDRDFRADNGWMPQVDTRLYLAGMNRRWWADDENTRWYSRLQLGGDLDYTEDHDGNLLRKEAELWFNYSGPLQTEINLGYGVRNNVYNEVRFDEGLGSLWFQMKPSGWLQLELAWRWGDEIDYANARPGRRLHLDPGIVLNLSRHLQLDLSHNYRRLDVEGGRLFTANLTQMRLVYQFNVRTFVRAIVQYQHLTRDQELYLDQVDSKDAHLFNQFLFSYKLNPQTVLFVGYSDNHREDDTIDLTQQNRTVFFKVGYAWRL